MRFAVDVDVRISSPSSSGSPGADDGGALEVQAKHFDEALHEMVVEGGDLMKSLLGASVAR
jgi:hypothetical protein